MSYFSPRTALLFLLAAAQPLTAAELPKFDDLSIGTGQELATIQPVEGQERQKSFSVVLNPRREAVLSAEVDSSVQKIVREFGQSFNKGEPLISLTPELFTLRLSQAEALYQQKRKNLEVIRELYSNKSRSVLDLTEAEAELRIAEVGRKLAAYDLARCTIRAPYSGRVEQLAVDEQEWVKAGDPLIKIVSDATLLARTLIPAGSLAAFPLGHNVQIELTGGRVVEGAVSHIGAVMDSASQTFEIKIEVANRKGELRSGMTGRIVQPEEKRKVEKPADG